MELKNRDEINEIYKWRMEDVYETEDLWEKDIENVKDNLPKLTEMKGIICSNSDNFKKTIDMYFDIQLIVEKVYFYANQKYYEDLGNSKYQTFSGKADNLLNVFMETVSFIEPEILQTSEETVMSFIKEQNMSDYVQYFKDLYRQNKHVLSEREEEILAATRSFSSGASDIFSVLNNVELTFEDAIDSNGKAHTVTHGSFIASMQSEDRILRENAFKSLYKTYNNYKNTIGTVYINSLKKDSFYAKVRNYPSSRNMFLDSNNIPEEVYDNLVDVVNKNLPLMHEYVALRKKLLGVEQMHMYDIYTPLIDNPYGEISLEKAKKTILEGLKPLGDEYISLLKKGFDERWIDVYENKGKRSGAYSWTVYGSHPYVLLNFQPNLDTMFTIAHEMGHSLHSYYSNANQPYVNSEYRIFVAEVASTCNEILLIRYLIENADSDLKKAYLINHMLEQFRGTLFRQTMFAEFEKIVHKKTDDGEILNCEELCNIYHDLNKKYYGDDVVSDDEIALEWARIPHFYTSFYVYQYATAYSAATTIADKILTEGESAVNDYKKFLKSGCSDYPIEVLKYAGVDMSKPQPIAQAMEVFKKMLDEMKKVVDKK